MGIRLKITEDENPDDAMLMLITIEALKQLGRSATGEEIRQKIVEIDELTEEEQSYRNKDQAGQKRLNYRSRWARQALKLAGALENDSNPRIWSITEKGTSITEITPCIHISRGYYGDESLQEDNPVFQEDNYVDEEIERMLSNAKSREIKYEKIIIKKPNELTISIDKEFLYKLWLKNRDKCALCHENMDWKFRHPLLKPSIDRINSKLPYTKSNVGIVHLACNLAKRDATVYEFNEYLKVIRA